MPDGPVDAIEIEIDMARARAQAALDDLCEVVKRALQDRRHDTAISFTEKQIPAILQDPHKTSETSGVTSAPATARPTIRDSRPAEAPREPGSPTGFVLGKCHRAILTVLAQYQTSGRIHSAQQMAILSGYSKSGSFDTALADLRDEGLVDGNHINETGRERLGRWTPHPTGRGLLELWIEKQGKCGKAILRALAAGSALDAEHLASRANYSKSGSFDEELALLRRTGLITEGRPIDLTPELK